MPRTLAILVFEGFEPLDVVGPFEAFLCADDEAGNPLFNVGLVAATEGPVTATGRLVMTPRWSFDTLPHTDILLVPGGDGTEAVCGDRAMLEWVTARDSEAEMTLSVCTGAQVLASAGLLKGLKATTYWKCYDWLRSIDPTIEVMEGARWADNGRIVCSSGVSAGIDMALHVIGRLHGQTCADTTARAMEYEHWPLRD
jgi:transcriptional regulator GlxA family with amidase domain